MVSCMFVFLTHLLLSLVPRFFSASSFLAQLALSALLLLFFVGFRVWCRRSLLKRRASAPTFVFFNVLFIWGFYILVIRQSVPLLNNVVFSCEVVFLLIGLYGWFFFGIITSDPGVVTNGFASSDQVVAGFWFGHEGTILQELQAIHKGSRPPLSSFWELYRVLVWVRGYDIAEAARHTYRVSTTMVQLLGTVLVNNNSLSTSSIHTSKCTSQINWKNYPEFQRVVQPHPGKNFTSIRFRNPYDKGILQNVREF